MKEQILSHKKTILYVASGVALFVSGGLLVPSLVSKADPTSTSQDCQSGYHQVITISPLGTDHNTYDCVQDDSTPQTAPANQTPAVATPQTTVPSQPVTTAPTNCH